MDAVRGGRVAWTADARSPAVRTREPQVGADRFPRSELLMRRFSGLLWVAPVLLAACAAEPSAPSTSASTARPDTAQTVEAPDADVPTAAETFAPASPPADSVWVGDPPTRVPGPYRVLPDGWTTGVVEIDTAPAAGVATLTDLRTARHDGFDRAVFTFDGPVPGLSVAYVDTPVHACGSGEALRLAGDGWLSVTLRPARAHTAAGRATVADRRARPALPAILERVVTCDFEAELQVVFGVAAPTPYRLLRLRDPDRLVVDVRHGR